MAIDRMTEHTMDSTSEAQTEAIGRRLGAALRVGDVIALVGQLGAGKTRLVKGIAQGAGVADERTVNSPTFVIVNEYAAELNRGGPAGRSEPLRLFHIDAYRLRGGGDLEALGLEEMPRRGVVMIEWADRVADVLPPDVLSITMSVEGPVTRRLEASAAGRRSMELLAAMAG
jgi:tRNA threonylcarbamoyladenosine biosynthesis protein TsaE